MAATAAELLVRVGADTSELRRGLKRTERRVQKTARAMKSMGRKMTMFVSAPLAAAGAAAVKTASDFEESFSRMEGLVGVSSEQVAQFRNEIKQLGPAVGQAPGDLADAMFFITSAGLEGEQAMRALEASAKAASAGLGDTKTVADAATSAMNAYGKETLSARQATDTLVATVREGKVEPAELSQSLGKVIPTAAAVGVEFEQVGAAMAAMTRQGANARRATTALNSLLTQLQKPSKEAKETLSQVGLTMATLRKRVREDGLLAVMNLLQNEFQGNTEALASLFGNVRAMRAALQLTGENADDTRKIFSQLADTTGATDDAFAKAKETFNFQFGQLRASVRRLGIEMGNELLPLAKDLVSTLRDLTDQFAGLSKEAKKNALIWSGVALAAGPVLRIMGGLFNVITKLPAAVRTLGSAVKWLTGLFNAISVPITAVIGAGLIRWMREAGGEAAKMQEKTDSLRESFEKLTKSIDFGDPTEKQLSKLRGLWKTAQSRVDATAQALKKVKGKIQNLKGTRVSVDYFDQLVKQKESLKAQLNTRKALASALEKQVGVAMRNFQATSNTADAEKEKAENAERTANALGQQASAARNALQKVKTFQQRMNDLRRSSRDVTEGGKAEPASAGGSINVPGQIDRLNVKQEKLAGLRKRVRQVRSSWDTWGISAQQVGKVVGGFMRSLSSQMAVAIQRAGGIGEAFRNMGSTVVSALQGMIAKLGTAVALAGVLTAVTGGGSAALGGGFGGILTNLIGFADGGLVTGPTMAMVGEGPGTSKSNPEVVAPLDKLKGMLADVGGGGQQGGTLKASIGLDELIFAIDQRRAHNNA